MNYRYICMAGMVARHDLKTAHLALEAGVNDVHLRLLLMRHIILELGNVADLANIASPMLKDHAALRNAVGQISKGLEFFKYIRNIFVGHFVTELADKTFEWKPEVNALAGLPDQGPDFVLSLSALETAINTYADPENGHKVFQSDTDLNYPPDNTRFLNYLGEIVVHALTYLDALIDLSRAEADIPEYRDKWPELAMQAGLTDFSKLTKGKR